MRGAIVAGILSRSEVAREPGLEPAPDSAEALRLARRIVDLASDKQASDIVLLDIRGVSLIADYFVICTAGSERQTAAILKDLGEKVREEFYPGRKPLHSEGSADSGWVLLDYGDVIVHIFSPTQRAFSAKRQRQLLFQGLASNGETGRCALKSLNLAQSRSVLRSA